MLCYVTFNMKPDVPSYMNNSMCSNSMYIGRRDVKNQTELNITKRSSSVKF